jgi:hypothetical protein
MDSLYHSVLLLRDQSERNDRAFQNFIISGLSIKLFRSLESTNRHFRAQHLQFAILHCSARAQGQGLNEGRDGMRLTNNTTDLGSENIKNRYLQLHRAKKTGFGVFRKTFSATLPKRIRLTPL